LYHRLNTTAWIPLYIIHYIRLAHVSAGTGHRQLTRTPKVLRKINLRLRPQKGKNLHSIY